MYSYTFYCWNKAEKCQILSFISAAYEDSTRYQGRSGQILLKIVRAIHWDINFLPPTITTIWRRRVFPHIFHHLPPLPRTARALWSDQSKGLFCISAICIVNPNPFILKSNLPRMLASLNMVRLSLLWTLSISFCFLPFWYQFIKQSRCSSISTGESDFTVFSILVASVTRTSENGKPYRANQEHIFLIFGNWKEK